MTEANRRLAIVTTHPIQYYAPWFRWMAANSGIDLKVFYLWDRSASAHRDPGFGHAVEWDLPLLEGYESEFVPNEAKRPGTDRFRGIRNSKLESRIKAFAPDAALLIGYRYDSLLRLILTSERKRGFPLLLRGDSHRLSAQNAKGEMRKAELKEFVRRKAISAIFRRISGFLYVGKANRDYFRLHGVPEEKLFFAPHAVDNDRFMGNRDRVQQEAVAWRRELGISADHLLVLFAGKFEDKKRPLDLLEAFRFIGRSDVSLLFVGSGKQESELRNRAASVANVFFAPFQNQSVMPRTYAASDLFVLPSYGPEETWGLAINEALCLARPVIISSHVGCGPDLVRQGENGLIFPAGDVEALTTALHEALSDPMRLKQWGEAGRKIVSNYNYAAATGGLLTALEAVALNCAERAPR
ncbi:MAG: glycosyltransferase family 4 protein [Chthoniobacterales bacterium]|nr:glycosyltransferase family 4 protein [Chthoniobacterales bacterium]